MQKKDWLFENRDEILNQQSVDIRNNREKINSYMRKEITRSKGYISPEVHEYYFKNKDKIEEDLVRAEQLILMDHSEKKKIDTEKISEGKQKINNYMLEYNNKLKQKIENEQKKNLEGNQ